MRAHPPGSPRLLLALVAMVLLAGCDHYAARAADGPSLTPAPSPAVAPLANPCQPPDVGAPVSVELVLRSDGTCAPFHTAFAYRCDPAQPAVAVVDDGRGL